ncbi:MAG: type II toxin-antitoxin system RelE/ParE family toxin [Candidatus Woesebacteria bacterium]|nr:type II toxin-antitoxin system RelE/ParE family toxin [Candidatus Woesebacteria bacterium]
MYKLFISSGAERELKKISKDPLLGKPLTRNFTGMMSYRVGVYRIVYKVRIKDNVIEILTAGHRSIVYN